MTDPSASFTIEDVVYHRPGGLPLTARLYRPRSPGPHPAVVDAHGGRWCAETRLTNRVIDEALATAGVFVMAVDFRMPPVARFPQPVGDINFAIRWLKANATGLNVNAGAIGAVGTSSGGHQVLLNALNPDDPKFTVDHPPGFANFDAALDFVVVCWPVADPPARYRYAIENKMGIHIESHDAYWPDMTAMEEGSPQRIVTEGAASHLPPMLMIQGDKDVILTPDMADQFANAYRERGGEATLRKFAGEGHTFITKNPSSPSSLKALADITTFVHEHTSANT
jgi:acetyl esterase